MTSSSSTGTRNSRRGSCRRYLARGTASSPITSSRAEMAAGSIACSPWTGRATRLGWPGETG
eukprot:229983-Rhodomonas_salina.1